VKEVAHASCVKEMSVRYITLHFSISVKISHTDKTTTINTIAQIKIHKENEPIRPVVNNIHIKLSNFSVTGLKKLYNYIIPLSQ
jgi:hypothetical protein